jgi:hypothetical protein
MNALNNLECYIALGNKGLPQTNTLALLGSIHKLGRK